MSLRHIVRIKARRVVEWDPESRKYKTVAFVRYIEPTYEGAGGSNQTDMQKAQVFGWAKRAVAKLNHFRADPDCYEVIPVQIVPATN